ncbi:hypothetical protein HYH03_011290 [Edaphochlamys debaryana]|uniref:Uncharacterized protein n=1 Tax=Edaphochlamys debaryana TaxID=47281 RepID=A0A835XWJ4_9CHLO|nr:hypothetical protein HYH03_011290 [Edaphochlamys debaryana]|eukprot:KAG2490343.1 hypothetical protein HYH03_011290 [Edaphochlamys debaryana]
MKRHSGGASGETSDECGGAAPDTAEAEAQPRHPADRGRRRGVRWLLFALRVAAAVGLLVAAGFWHNRGSGGGGGADGEYAVAVDGCACTCRPSAGPDPTPVCSCKCPGAPNPDGGPRAATGAPEDPAVRAPMPTAAGAFLDPAPPPVPLGAPPGQRSQGQPEVAHLHVHMDAASHTEHPEGQAGAQGREGGGRGAGRGERAWRMAAAAE